MSDRILVMQIVHVQAVQGLLSTEVMHLLLTDKLSKINVASWTADEPAYFWRLFVTCFELVSSAETTDLDNASDLGCLQCGSEHELSLEADTPVMHFYTYKKSS